MSEHKKVYYVDRATSRWDSDRFEELSDAEAYARKSAFTSGEDQFIFKAVHIAKKPEIVNSVVVEGMK